MNKKLLLFFVIITFLSTTLHAQFSVNGSSYSTFNAAVAAVPSTNVQTTINVTSDYTITSSVTVVSGQNILLKSISGMYTLKLGAVLSTNMIIINAGATLDIENVILDGGAIWSDESLTVQADTTRTNSGIVSISSMISNAGTLTIGSGTTIQNYHNIHGNGGNDRCGAIYNYNAGILNLNDGSMIKLTSFIVPDSSPTNGAGAIYNTGGSARVFMNGNATIAGCYCQCNPDGCDAGAIFNLFGATLTMNDDSQIFGCCDTYGGGGVTQRQYTFTMNGNSSIHHTVSRLYGGGVLCYTNATLEMNDSSSVHDNEGLMLSGGVSLLDNTSGGLSSILRMNGNSSIYGNKAGIYCGGVYNQLGWIFMNDNSSIRGNKAGTYCGGMYNNRGTVCINDNASISNNEAGTYAGGIYMKGTAGATAKLIMTGGSISSNKATTDYGGIYQSQYSKTTISGGEISNNTAANVGGLYADAINDTVNISGGKISGNTANIAAGIAIANQAVLNMTGGKISGNTATKKAGGLYIMTDVTYNPVANVLSGATIKGNAAPNGSAVYMRADKAGGPASVFNLDGTASIVGDIYLEKDTLNGLGGDPKRNKYITLVGKPTQNYAIATNPINDSQYGRIVVVPGTTTVDNVTYSLTDAMPYAANFTHNVKAVVEGEPGTFMDLKLILDCYGKGHVNIIQNPVDAATQLIYTNIDTMTNNILYKWTFPNGTPSTSTKLVNTVTWSSVGNNIPELDISETGLCYDGTDTMRCSATITPNSVLIWPSNIWSSIDQDNQTLPEWTSEYDKLGKTSIYAGCDMTMYINTTPDPMSDRTAIIRYHNIDGTYILDKDGNPLDTIHTIAKNEKTLALYFTIDTLVPYDGQKIGIEIELAGVMDTTLWYELYKHPSYESIAVTPYYNADGSINFGITGGTPNLMRSISGLEWRNAYLPLTNKEKESVTDGNHIRLREPWGCWEADFVFSFTNPEIQRYVDIPSVEGVTTIPVAGKHYLSGHNDFVFNATYGDGKPLKVTARGYYSNKILNLDSTAVKQDDGSYKYTIRQVVEPWTVTIGPSYSDILSGGVSNINVIRKAVWTYGNRLYINANTRSEVKIYSITGSLYKADKVMEGMTTITMERGLYMVCLNGKMYRVLIK